MRHLSVRWSGTLSQSVFFLWTFCFFSARPRRFGEKKVTRNIEKKAHGLSDTRLSRPWHGVVFFCGKSSFLFSRYSVIFCAFFARGKNADCSRKCRGHHTMTARSLLCRFTVFSIFKSCFFGEKVPLKPPVACVDHTENRSNERESFHTAPSYYTSHRHAQT